MKDTAMYIARSLVLFCSAGWFAGFAAAQNPPAAEEIAGLVAVPSKDFQKVLMRPGADLPATKAILEPAQVAFRAGWLKDMNRYRIALMQGTTERDAERVASDVGNGLDSTLAATFARAGIGLVATPAPGVVKLSPRIVDLYVNAPRSVTTALPGRTFTTSAGEATLVLDVRDATSGRLLGQITDHRIVGDRGDLTTSLRSTNPATNAFDFQGIFQDWADGSVNTVAGASSPAVARTQ